VRHRVRRARVTDKTDETPERSGRFAAEATSGASGRLGAGRGARSGSPVGAEPRVEVEAHRGPPPVRGPERLRANPAQRREALERALNDPGLRRARSTPGGTPRAR